MTAIATDTPAGHLRNGLQLVQLCRREHPELTHFLDAIENRISAALEELEEIPAVTARPSPTSPRELTAAQLAALTCCVAVYAEENDVGVLGEILWSPENRAHVRDVIANSRAALQVLAPRSA